ncbi:hypothetical protein GTW78_29075, partial [Streptomyces sp. SID4948]|nr:hypothetical protein [Streptomyces sp. SID4948]
MAVTSFSAVFTCSRAAATSRLVATTCDDFASSAAWAAASSLAFRASVSSLVLATAGRSTAGAAGAAGSPGFDCPVTVSAGLGCAGFGCASAAAAGVAVAGADGSWACWVRAWAAASAACLALMASAAR